MQRPQQKGIQKWTDGLKTKTSSPRNHTSNCWLLSIITTGKISAIAEINRRVSLLDAQQVDEV